MSKPRKPRLRPGLSPADYIYAFTTQLIALGLHKAHPEVQRLILRGFIDTIMWY